MRTFIICLGLALASLGNATAQVAVEVTLEQDQFLPGEALNAIVKVRNRSGQTLNLGRDADWLTFSVESREGFVVSRAEEAPVIGEFKLESSQVATKVVDLAPYFTMTRPGRYGVIAAVRIKDWNEQITSQSKDFDIITGAKLWTQEFGVPMAAGVSNQAPEVRRYTLQQANYLKKQLRLYLRLTDDAESRVYKVIPIGPLVGLSQPEPQVDQFSNLHILYQMGPRTFSYTAVSPNGDVLARETYEFEGPPRPRLQVTKEGRIVVGGGVRRVTGGDVPAPKQIKDEVQPPRK